MDFVFFFKQETAYEMRISDWSSDVCSSDLLVPFGDAGRLEAVLHSRPDVESDEIDEIGAEQQQLRHDRIIVVGGRQVAVAALLGFGPPYGMREMRREGLARETRRREDRKSTRLNSSH